MRPVHQVPREAGEGRSRSESSLSATGLSQEQRNRDGEAQGLGAREPRHHQPQEEASPTRKNGGMRAFRAKTLTGLHDKLCDTLLYAKFDELDLVTSVDVQIHNTMNVAESMEWDFDLKNMWLTKGRWSMMVRQYLDPVDMEIWLAKCVSGIGLRGRGISVLRTKVVRPRGGAAFGNRETRRWGSCMLALSYKAVPTPTITLHSRTSYLGYIGALDLSVAWMCARYLAKELDVPVESFRFVWYNEALQWHNFKSLAYLLNHRDPERQAEYRRLMLKKETKLSQEEIAHIVSSPALTMSREWIQKVVAEDKRGDTLGDMTYNTYRRIRRRYHTEVLGYEKAQQFEGWSYHSKGELTGQQKEYFKAYLPLPSVDVHDLDFSSIGLPFGRVLGTPLDFDTIPEDYDELLAADEEMFEILGEEIHERMSSEALKILYKAAKLREEAE